MESSGSIANQVRILVAAWLGIDESNVTADTQQDNTAVRYIFIVSGLELTTTYGGMTVGKLIGILEEAE